MSSTEPTLVPPHPHRRILWLVVGHLVVGLVGAFVAYFAGSSPTHAVSQLVFSASCSVKQVCWESGAVLDQIRGGRE